MVGRMVLVVRVLVVVVVMVVRVLVAVVPGVTSVATRPILVGRIPVGPGLLREGRKKDLLLLFIFFCEYKLILSI